MSGLFFTTKDSKGLKDHSFFAVFQLVDVEIYQFFSSCFFVFFVVYSLISVGLLDFLTEPLSQRLL